MPISAPPSLAITQQAPTVIRAAGTWQVHALAKGGTLAGIADSFKTLKNQGEVTWDLSEISGLDHIGAQWLWNAWGKKRPTQLKLAPHHENFFATIEKATQQEAPAAPAELSFLVWFKLNAADKMRGASDHALGFIRLIGQLVLDIGRMLSAPRYAPWKEISANVYHVGYRALGITALVGVLIGIVLSYLSAQQLHTFGGDVFLVNLLGMSIIRELGPMLAAILVAGRSGSAITAQLGVMRVTEELDAMLVMGLPHGFRLVLPRTLALALAMPLLVIWTDAMALIGGMLAARVELGLSPVYFLHKLPDAVPLFNYWIGLAKGVTFGGLIALVACHFGLRIKADTESLGEGTTTAVVTAITIVIVADAVFAIVFSNVGYS